MSEHRPTTLGELKAEGYEPRTVKDEMRSNLIGKLRSGEELFPGIMGFSDTVVPQIVNAVLAKHDFILLGLRGQAKSRILRQLVSLLDESVPIITGREINDDPLAPLANAPRRRCGRRRAGCRPAAATGARACRRRCPRRSASA